MRASSSRITRSLRVQPNRHPAMRFATMQLVHFFFSFAMSLWKYPQADQGVKPGVHGLRIDRVETSKATVA